MTAARASSQKLRVLVIDDDDIAREMLCDALREAGHDVRELPSAIGATRLIIEQNIQAVVLDVMMPSINGDKLAQLLRRAITRTQLTIILVSSCPVDELESLASAARVDAVVPKKDVRKELARSLQLAHRHRARMNPAVND